MARPPLVVYCDRLTWVGFIPLVRTLRSLARTNTLDVRVLDPIADGIRGVVLRRVVQALGFVLREEPFYAGHLASPEGIPAQRAAAESAMSAALPEARRVIERSASLTRMNAAWGRNTLRLHLCKAIAMTYGGERSLYGYALRVQVARALQVRDGGPTILLLQAPAMFGSACLAAMAPEIRIVSYDAAGTFAWSKRELARQTVRAAVRRLRTIRARIRRRRRIATLRAAAAARPGLLLPQEDDLASDRSYRGQPHWLFAEDPTPAFNTFVVAQKSGAAAPAADAVLARHRIAGLSDDDLLALGWSGTRPPIVAAAWRDAHRCRLAGLRSRCAVETVALAVASRLFATAAELGAACARLNVRAFLTAENYLVGADAMTLIGDALGVHTLAYQYTNIALRSPLMMTTADVMLTFSRAFPPHWVADDIAPRAFVEIGYPFDSSFAKVDARAAAARHRLHAAGAATVIAYFDENVLRGTKYGLTTFEEHCAELRRLLELVVGDPTIGLITKVQFERNSASRIPELRPLAQRAAQTGRYLELLRGAHRNVVLPAEAALAADITIGHAIGGTAALEAALAGRRSVLLNPYRMRDANHAEYARADILFADLDDALGAIEAFRRGNRPRLGDWTAILPRFDAFRDGRAGLRLRAILDNLLAESAPRAGTVDLGDRLARLAAGAAPQLAVRAQ